MPYVEKELGKILQERYQDGAVNLHHQFDLARVETEVHNSLDRILVSREAQIVELQLEDKEGEPVDLFTLAQTSPELGRYIDAVQ